MGGNYTGDIFKDKELVATNLTGENKDYMSLQIKGDEYFDDGKAKYLGVDTLYTEISGAKNAFGFKFVADSTYKGPAGGGIPRRHAGQSLRRKVPCGRKDL